MDGVQTRARFDWLVELGGAAALGLAAGFAALKAAPSLAFPTAAAMTGSAFAAFGLGLMLMRTVKPGPRALALPQFAVELIDADELLLDMKYQEPLLLEDLAEDGALLLDDPLAEAHADSRVVQLFASPPLPTPGQLKERIDRHLAGDRRPNPEPAPPAADAAGALYAALADLRRTLR